MVRLSIFYLLWTTVALVGAHMIGDIGYISLTGQNTYPDTLGPGFLWSLGTIYACRFALIAFLGSEKEGKDAADLLSLVLSVIAAIGWFAIVLAWPAPHKGDMLQAFMGGLAILPFLLMLMAWDRSWRSTIGLPT
jgi:hypothetical protein